MMSKSQVVLGYSDRSTQDKSDYGKEVAVAMTGNDSFPSPPVSLSDVTAEADLLEKRFIASRDGTKEQTQLMYQTDFNLGVMLDFLAAYVQYVANTSPEDKREGIIVSAAMRSKGLPSQNKQQITVDNTEMAGEVELEMKSEGRGASYNWEVMEEGGKWELSHSTTDSKTIITGLNAGSRYFFRATVTKGQSTGPHTVTVDIIVT